MWRLFRWFVTFAALAALGLAVFLPAAAWWKERSRPRYLTAKVTRGKRTPDSFPNGSRIASGHFRLRHDSTA